MKFSRSFQWTLSIWVDLWLLQWVVNYWFRKICFGYCCMLALLVFHVVIEILDFRLQREMERLKKIRWIKEGELEGEEGK